MKLENRNYARKSFRITQQPHISQKEIGTLDNLHENTGNVLRVIGSASGS